MLTDLESLIPSACLAVGFVLLVKTILKYQNPQRRAAARAREAAAEASDPRIMHDQAVPAELKSKIRTESSKPNKRPAAKAKAQP
ncbi:MAG TPA: hypothetical protein VH372_17425 [Actinospica sp.]|jgi:hypothetical protein|nr:hypothetical protein [Actinospica sp.]